MDETQSPSETIEAFNASGGNLNAAPQETQNDGIDAVINDSVEVELTPEQQTDRVPDSVQRAAAVTAAVGAATAERANRARDWLAMRPTPGSVALLVIILLLLMFVLVPVTASGKTRAQLLWALIGGRAELIGSRRYRTTSTSSNVPIDVAPVPDDGGVVMSNAPLDDDDDDLELPVLDDDDDDDDMLDDDDDELE